MGALLLSLIGCARDPSKQDTKTSGSNAEPELGEEISPSSLAPVQWKEGSLARRTGIQALRKAYSETQSLRASSREDTGLVICVHLLNEAANIDEQDIDREILRIDSCVELAKKLNNLLQNPQDPDVRLREIRTLLPSLSRRDSRHPKRLLSAKAHLEISRFLYDLKTLASRSGSPRQEQSISLLKARLLEIAPLLFEALMETAHSPDTSLFFKDVLAARLWRKASWLGEEGIPSPWSSPKAWSLPIGSQYFPLLSDNAEALSRALLIPFAPQETIPSLLNRPLFHANAAAFAEESPAQIDKLLGENKAIDPRALHDSWRREAARIARVSRLVISLIRLFDSERALLLQSALDAAVEAHGTIVAFGRGEIANSIFLARIAQLGSRLSRNESTNEYRVLTHRFNSAMDTFANRFTSLEREVAELRSILAEETRNNAARAREIENELIRISARLARQSDFVSSALQASLRQPYELQQERCLGANSFLARHGRFSDEEYARECFDMAKQRASLLAFEPALTQIIDVEELSFDPLRAPSDLLWPWLAQYSSLVFPNPREWSLGVEGMLLTILTSNLGIEASSTLAPFLRTAESMQVLEEAISRKENLENAWNDSIQSLRAAQNALTPIWESFSLGKMYGVDPSLYPSRIIPLNREDSLLQIAIRAGIASEHPSSVVRVVNADGITPHTWDPHFPRPIFVRYDWWWDAILSGVNIGKARAALLFFECDQNITACRTSEPITTICDRNTYLRVRENCSGQALSRQAELRAASMDTSSVDEKIASALLPVLAPAYASFPQFVSSHRDSEKAREAILTAKRAVDRYLVLLRLAYPNLIESSAEIQSLWLGKDSLLGESPFWKALGNPQSMQNLIRADLASLSPRIASIHSEARATPIISSVARALLALFRDGP